MDQAGVLLVRTVIPKLRIIKASQRSRGLPREKKKKVEGLLERVLKVVPQRNIFYTLEEVVAEMLELLREYPVMKVEFAVLLEDMVPVFPAIVLEPLRPTHPLDLLELLARLLFRVTVRLRLVRRVVQVLVRGSLLLLLL